jgi:hypothetical protein
MANIIKKPIPGKIVCPCCGDYALRRKRTLPDRLLSLIKPIKRYRCDFCEWSGTVTDYAELK